MVEISYKERGSKQIEGAHLPITTELNNNDDLQQIYRCNIAQGKKLANWALDLENPSSPRRASLSRARRLLLIETAVLFSPKTSSVQSPENADPSLF